ncbi:hypothetical protein BS17DRAFT_783296 [Gyrodon lividus]|nr:hypothetical protein BS17DRAFT_783296 [Gyrodon lividus]
MVDIRNVDDQCLLLKQRSHVLLTHDRITDPTRLATVRLLVLYVCRIAQFHSTQRVELIHFLDATCNDQSHETRLYPNVGQSITSAWAPCSRYNVMWSLLETNTVTQFPEHLRWKELRISSDPGRCSEVVQGVCSAYTSISFPPTQFASHCGAEIRSHICSRTLA